MRYRELQIQTLREAPNNARCEGAAFLARAGYWTREGEVLPLGQRAIERLKKLATEEAATFFPKLGLPVVSSEEETFFLSRSGPFEVLHCPACGCVARADQAVARKFGLPEEEPRAIQKVATPGANTIEALANFLGIPKEKTAKALMFTRVGDGRLVFVVVRGDMTLSEAKLKRQVGEVRLATPEEIRAAGAAPGYASPVGLKGALIVVDDRVPISHNLAAGANEEGYHLLNVNCGRDYQPEIIADLTLARAGDPCSACNAPLELENAELVALHGQVDLKSTLLALAESNHDEKGLRLPREAAPFDVYLMHVPGKEMDTRAKTEELYHSLEATGVAALFDDRDERAGVKFNDADLIGAPLRVTVGEKGLKEGKVEVKRRGEGEVRLVEVARVVEEVEK